MDHIYDSCLGVVFPSVSFSFPLVLHVSLQTSNSETFVETTSVSECKYMDITAQFHLW